MADASAPHHTLVMQCVAALLQRTLGCPTVEAHQHALQGFLDDLTPWITPVELPTRFCRKSPKIGKLIRTNH